MLAVERMDYIIVFRVDLVLQVVVAFNEVDEVLHFLAKQSVDL